MTRLVTVERNGLVGNYLVRVQGRVSKSGLTHDGALALARWELERLAIRTTFDCGSAVNLQADAELHRFNPEEETT